MKASLNTIKRYVNDGSCRVHEAICLIYDFEPSTIIRESKTNYRDVQFKYVVTEFEALFNLLCEQPMWWLMQYNIFYYTDRALKNNIKVSKKLLKEINQYASNLIDTDLDKFKDRYSYLTRTMNPQEKKHVGVGTKTILKTERDQKWREMANEQFKNKSNLKLKEVAECIYSALEKVASEYLKQANGKMVSVGTIMRIIKKR